MGPENSSMFSCCQNRGHGPSWDPDELSRVKTGFNKMTDDDAKQWQLAAAKTVFRAMDKNGNGQLTHKEIKNYLNKDEEAKTLLVTPGQPWSELWDKMDSDKRNHMIDETEFIQFYLEKCGCAPKETQE